MKMSRELLIIAFHYHPHPHIKQYVSLCTDLISTVADLADVARYGEGAGGGVEAVHALVILRLPGLLRLAAAGALAGAGAGGGLVGVLTTRTWKKRTLQS